MSYPALYTHIKTKHSNKQKPSSVSKSKARGRPKKLVASPSESRKTLLLEPINKKEENETTEVFFKALQEMRMILGRHYEKLEDYPLFQSLKRLLHLIYIKEVRKEVKCDDAFAEFLLEIEKQTVKENFVRIVKFVIAFRECLNKYGWEKLFEEKEVEENKEPGSDSPRITTHLSSSIDQQIKIKEEYCIVNNPEYAPEIANEFIILFLNGSNTGLSMNEAISLVLNMSKWLYKKGYTHTEVILIK